MNTEQDYFCVLSGFSDFHGCGHRLLPRWMGTAESCSEDFVQERDARELQEPAFTG